MLNVQNHSNADETYARSGSSDQKYASQLFVGIQVDLRSTTLPGSHLTARQGRLYRKQARTLILNMLNVMVQSTSSAPQTARSKLLLKQSKVKPDADA